MTEDLLKVKNLLKFRGCSVLTINGYLTSIKRFKNYFEGMDIKNFNEEDIVHYLMVNYIDLNRSPITINRIRTSLKYYYMVNFNKELNNILLPVCKRVPRYPKVMSNDDIIYIINNEDNLKHKVWLCLAYGSGLRVSEVASINISNFSYKRKQIRVIGKGNKERYTIFPNYTHDILLKYYNEYKDDIISSGGYLFPNHMKNYNGKHITSRVIQNYFSKLKIKYQLDKDITFHTLRHSFATEFIKNGGDILKLRLLMGHSSFSSTIRYIHMAENYKLLCSPIDRNIL